MYNIVYKCHAWCMVMLSKVHFTVLCAILTQHNFDSVYKCMSVEWASSIDRWAIFSNRGLE